MKSLWCRIRLRFALLANFVYDWRRYSRNSFVVQSRTRENRRALIHILAHSLEHGMSLSQPRKGYGREKATSLIGKLESYLEDFGADGSSDMALDVLRAYHDYQSKTGTDLPNLKSRLDALGNWRSGGDATDRRGGVEQVTRQEIEAATAFDFTRFMQTRHSVRQFADKPVNPETIKRAVANAQQAPSVCNRQTCRVYALTEKDAMSKALAYQSGNAGFGHELGALFVITSNMQHLNLIGERYQGWIDGGIFAMALVLSLHAEGLGTCCLNWSVDRQRDRELRAHMGIPDGELVITMMGAGQLKDVFEVPVSYRKPLETVLLMDSGQTIDGGEKAAAVHLYGAAGARTGNSPVNT